MICIFFYAKYTYNVLQWQENPLKMYMQVKLHNIVFLIRSRFVCDYKRDMS